MLYPITRFFNLLRFCTQAAIHTAVICFGLLLPASIQAATLTDFDAIFAVDAFDIKLGTSSQSLRCVDQECVLTATAKPSGLASLFIKESTEENIRLKQTDKQLIWQSYLKKTITRDAVKTVRFVKTQENPPQVHYVEKDRFWPLQNRLYDMVSIAYALQFYRLNQQPLTGFHLQDTGYQAVLDIKLVKPDDVLELADLKTEIDAEQYHFETSKAKVKIWLLPRYDYFPGRIDVYNIESEKTITLLLEEPPKPL